MKMVFSNEASEIRMNQIADTRYEEPSSSLACLEVQKLLPQDLLSRITVMYQNSGYITISPLELSGLDWRTLNGRVKHMGGIWVSNKQRSHWSIPFSRAR